VRPVPLPRTVDQLHGTQLVDLADLPQVQLITDEPVDIGRPRRGTGEPDDS
jgi:hypothetical protein